MFSRCTDLLSYLLSDLLSSVLLVHGAVDLYGSEG